LDPHHHSVAGGYITYLNPAQKWHELRSAALALESEIWRFRTRVGGYNTSQSIGDHYSRDAENSLSEFLAALKQHVFKSAGLQETPFYARLNVFAERSSSNVRIVV
jgi:hypothetical protein